MGIQEFLFGKKEASAFTTRLTIEECIGVLKKSVAQNNWVPFSHFGEVAGHLKGEKFSLWYISPNRNSWRPVYYGEFRTQGKRTLIDGFFSPPSFIKVFTMIWLSFAILFLSGGIIFYLIDSTQREETLPMIIGTAVAIVGASLLCRIGIIIGGTTQPEIYKFITHTFKATKIDSKSTNYTKDSI